MISGDYLGEDEESPLSESDGCIGLDGLIQPQMNRRSLVRRPPMVSILRIWLGGRCCNCEWGEQCRGMPVFGGGIVKRLEHQMLKQCFVMKSAV